MIKRIKKLIKREMFFPSFWSILINPVYIIRAELLKNIKVLAPELEGLLLDIGCGEKPYRELFDVKEYIGLEIDRPMANNIRQAADAFYDGTTMPFKDEHFQAVFASEVFEHVFTLPKLLKEINRVMMPGGKILITLPFAWEQHEKPHDFARYTSFGIRYLLNENGFEVIKQINTAGAVKSIHQMWSSYVYNNMLPSNNIAKWILMPLVIFPLNLLGIIFSKLFPYSEDMYLNNVILAKKIR